MREHIVVLGLGAVIVAAIFSMLTEPAPSVVVPIEREKPASHAPPPVVNSAYMKNEI